MERVIKIQHIQYKYLMRISRAVLEWCTTFIIFRIKFLIAALNWVFSLLKLVSPHGKHERLAVALWRWYLFFILLLCTAEFVRNCPWLFTFKFINDSMYSVDEVKSVAFTWISRFFTNHTCYQHAVNYKCMNFVKLFSDVFCISGTLNAPTSLCFPESQKPTVKPN